LKSTLGLIDYNPSTELETIFEQSNTLGLGVAKDSLSEPYAELC